MITVTLKIKEVPCDKGHGKKCRHVDVVAKARGGRSTPTQKEKFACWLLRRAINKATKELHGLKNASEAHDYYMRNGGELIQME